MKIEVTIDISCKTEEVFSWISEYDKAMCWQKGVKGGEIIKKTPQRIGTTFKEEMEENGKCLVMYGEITDYIPDKLISFQLESKIHIVHVKYIVAGDNNKSTVNVKSLIKWKFPMNMICLIIGKKIKTKIMQQTESEMTGLKKLCETIN